MPNYEWWSEPIIDRTQEDITFKTSKAYLNALDTSRIEGNIGIISRDFDVALITKEWQKGEFLRATDMRRILNNTGEIKDLLNLSSEPYNTMLHWNDLNIIEHLLSLARGVFLMLIDWDCFECQFDTWDDFESEVISWNYFEQQLRCQNTNTWTWFEDKFVDWTFFEAEVATWEYFECPNEQGVI